MNRGSALGLRRIEFTSRGFNEAPIHESGKSAQRRHHQDAGGSASMRPRFMNRGSGDGPEIPTGGKELQ